MPVSININGADAAETIRELAALAAGINGAVPAMPEAVVSPTPVQPAAPVVHYAEAPPVYAPPAPVPTAPAPTVQAPAAPPVTSTFTTAPGAVPTTETSYTFDQLAVAATQLVDAGQQPAVVGLLGQFGVQALTQLPKEQYGAFATALRGLGARI